MVMELSGNIAESTITPQQNRCGGARSSAANGGVGGPGEPDERGGEMIAVTESRPFYDRVGKSERFLFTSAQTVQHALSPPAIDRRPGDSFRKFRMGKVSAGSACNYRRDRGGTRGYPHGGVGLGGERGTS